MSIDYQILCDYTLLPDSERLPRVGVIVLSTDLTLESDIRIRFPAESVDLYVSRVPSADHVGIDSLAAIREEVGHAASLLPSDYPFDVIAYGCTSGSAVAGAEAIEAEVHAGVKCKVVTNPLSALIETCRARDIKRIAMLSPYVQSVSEVLTRQLANAGIETLLVGSFNESEEARVARIDEASIISGVQSLLAHKSASEVQAVFLSCTNLRTRGVFEQIADEFPLPLLSSNQVLADAINSRVAVADAISCTYGNDDEIAHIGSPG